MKKKRIFLIAVLIMMYGMNSVSGAETKRNSESDIQTDGDGIYVKTMTIDASDYEIVRAGEFDVVEIDQFEQTFGGAGSLPVIPTFPRF